MFKDLKDFLPNSTLEYDICIIGSGPAGISLAKQLLGTKFKIAILESGGIEPEDEYQDLNEGENSGPSYLSLYSSRLRCFGGAGKLWAGVCAPFKDDEFNKKPYIELSGWPISFNDLETYYKKAAKLLGISFEKFYDKTLIGDTFKEMSFREFNRDNSLLSANVFQISSSKDRDLAEKFKTEFKTSVNAHVIFHSTVTELNLSSSGTRIESVSVADLNGNKSNIKSKIFILACGALENPRILLMSNKSNKKGIGNDNGLVGACFMSHPGIMNVAEIYKTSSNYCVSQDGSNIKHKVVFEISSKERFKQKTLRHSLSIKPNKTLLEKPSFKNTNLIDRVACFFKRDHEFSPKKWSLDIGLEQPPRLSNKLLLDKSKDNLGMPKINMYWDDISEIEKDTVTKTTKTMARELGILGTGRIKFKDELLSGESYKIDDPINHHIGTTRMSDSSKTGVVDKNCKVFGISNLYIAGSSVFATSSIVNPTYTIVALSIRLGEYIKNIKL